MKKKKILLGALIVAVSLCSVTACKTKTKKTTTTDTTPTTVTTTDKPDEKTHSVYFIVDGAIVGSVQFKEGDTSILEFAVPKKDGYIGSWDSLYIR